MIHHIEIYVSNLGESYAFWSAILSRIGYTTNDKWNNGFTLSSGQDAYLTFVQVESTYSDLPYHRCGTGLNHLAFRVKDRQTVDSLKQYCVERRISCLYEDRYPFANGGTDYYALFVEDPDRIKVEFVAS